MAAGKRIVLEIGLVAITILALMHVSGVDSGLTGFLTFEQDVALEVTGGKDAELSRFGFDQVIVIGNSTFIDVELTNTGAVPVMTNFNVTVSDINNTLLYTYPGPRTRVMPGAHTKRTIKHTPHKTGTYIIRVRAVGGDEVMQGAQFLLVNEKPEPPEPQPAVIVRKQIEWIYPPPPEPTQPPTRSWQVDVPQQVDLEQNGSTTIPIRISNTGEARIRNVHLGLTSSANLSVTYEPQIMFTIPPGSARNFVLTLSADHGTLSDQNISYNVISDNLRQSGEVNVNIVPAMTIAQLEREIGKLKKLVRDAEAEIAEARVSGLDVEEANSLLRETKLSIQDAEESLEEEDLAATKAHISEARGRIGEVFQTLFKQRSEQLIVQAPLVRPVYLLILVSILVAALMVGGYYYLREKHEERPKLLRDLEER